MKLQRRDLPRYQVLRDQSCMAVLADSNAWASRPDKQVEGCSVLSGQTGAGLLRFWFGYLAVMSLLLPWGLRGLRFWGSAISVHREQAQGLVASLCGGCALHT